MAEYNAYNPIRIVDGETYVPAPSKYQWGLQDISDSESGRTEDELMHKNRIGQKIKLELEWDALSIAEAAEVLQAFNPEYVEITYLDALEGGFQTKTFYIGDRSAPLFNAYTGLWDSISFNAIEQ